MLRRKRIIPVMVAAILGLGGQAAPDVAQAGGIFNMMNPSRWFGNDRDDYYRGRGGGPYGWGGGPYGWGGGPYGWGGGPYGWGGGPYGWGGGPYGWGGRGYGQPSTIIVTPSSGEKSAPKPPE